MTSPIRSALSTDKPRFVGERVRMPLSALGKIVTGNTPSKKIDDYWTTHDIPFVKPNDIGEAGVTFLEHGAEYIANEAAKKARLVGSNAVLVTCIGTIAKVAIVDCDRVAFNQQINAICTDESTVNPFYLAYAIKAHENELRALANTAVVPIVNKSQFGSFALGIDPNLRNQNEVVARLRAVEAQQELMKMIIEYLESLVKSRFVEMFGAFDLSLQKSAWYPIKQLGQVVSGATPKTSIGKYWDGGIKWITPAELSDMSGWVYDSARHITEEGLNSCGARMMPVGTVILSSRAPIGKMALLGDSMCCNQGFKNIVCGDRVIPEYLYYLLGFNTAYLNSLGRGATFKELSKRSVEEIKIPVPSIKAQGEFVAFTQQVDKLRFAGNHEMNFRCERFTLS